MECPRSITFTLPGSAGSPGVEVSAHEVDGGRIEFSLKVLQTASLTADLRGLFFDLADDAKLPGLSYTQSGAATITDFDTIDVLSLKGGANMNGAASPFDVGFEFGTSGIGKDDIKTATFTLSSADGNLTLDDIAHVDFGVRLASIGAPWNTKRSEKDGAKLVATSPAAPDAHDDHFAIFEDGASGLNEAREHAQGVKFQVLANDTDADGGDVLSVMHVEGASHGTLAIVDGDDADSLPGDAILYTPADDYAGSDAFSYCVSDGHGGIDSAHVSVDIAAVADKADVQVSVVDAADAVNQVRLLVTASPADNDGSEVLTSLAAGSTPAGVTIAPLDAVSMNAQGQLSQSFMVTLPQGQGIAYDQLFFAGSKEQSNADTEVGSGAQHIESVFKDNALQAKFEVDDASLWADGQGPQAQVQGPLLGIEVGPDIDIYPYPLRYQVQAEVHAGFQPYLTIEGGSIDASLDYDVDVQTTHNKTTDTLMIRTDAALTGGQFSTQGPGGSMGVDFVFGYDVAVKLGIDLDGDADVAEAWFVDTAYGDQWSLFNLFDIQDGDGSIAIDGSWLNGTSGSVQWADVDVTGSSFDAGTGSVSGGGSQTFLAVQSDLDSLLTGAVLGNVSPFDIPVVADTDVDPMTDVGGFLRLLDLDVGAQLKLMQDFELTAKDLTGTLTFENGSTMPIVFGQDLVIQNALATIDATSAGGNGNGRVDYTISFDGLAQLHNQTQVGVERTVDYKVLELDVAYDVDWVAYSAAGTVDTALVDVHSSSTELVGVADQTFALDMGSVSWDLSTAP